MANLNLVIIPARPVLQADFIAELNTLVLELYDQNLVDVGADLSTLTPVHTYDFSTSTAWHPTGDGSYATVPSQNIGNLSDQYPNGTDAIDLRVVLRKGGSDVIFDQNLAFNIVGVSGTDPNAYVVVPIGGSTVSELFRQDGKAPGFDLLQNYVAEVIKDNDPGIASISQAIAAIKDLSFEECLFIAKDLAWNQGVTFPPEPDRKLKKILDYDFLSGPSDSDKDKWKEKRTSFYNELQAYYDRPERQAQQLAQYIWTLSCAQWAENESAIVDRILFRLPTIPPDSSATGLTGLREILIKDLAAGHVQIDARFFYAAGSELPAAVNRTARYEQFITTEQQILLDTFTKAEEERIISLSALSQTPKQVVRLARAQHTNRYELVEFDASGNTEVNTLIQYWGNYTGDASLNFWKDLLAVTPSHIPISDIANCKEGHGDLILSLLVQGNADLYAFLEPAVSADTLTLSSGTWTPYDSSPNTAWQAVYSSAISTDAQNDSVTFLPPGTIAERADFFAIHTLDFFNQSVTVTVDPLGAPTPNGIPYFVLAQDPISELALNYDAPPSDADLISAIATLIPDDECAQEWLYNKVQTLIGLHQLTASISPLAIRQSAIETLYSLGITSPEQVGQMDQQSFGVCVTDTMLADTKGSLTDLGNTVWDNRAVSTITSDPANFKPINTGDLVDCRPPAYASKLGRFAYLQDLLAFQLDGQSVAELLQNEYDLNFQELLVNKANADWELPQQVYSIQLLANSLCSEPGDRTVCKLTGVIQMIENICEITLAELKDPLLEIRETLDILNNDLADALYLLATSIYDYRNSGLKAYLNELVTVLGDVSASSESDVYEQASVVLTETSGNPIAITLNLLLPNLQNAAPEGVTVTQNSLSALLGNQVAQAIHDMLSVPVMCEEIERRGHQPNIGNTPGELFIQGQPLRREDFASFPSSFLTDEQDCARQQLTECVGANCELPYHFNQSVSQHYLDRLNCNRFELSRKFSQHIHAFSPAPHVVPTGFRSHLHRLPVKHEQVLEYLGIYQELYDTLYTQAPNFDPAIADPSLINIWELFGFTDFEEFEQQIIHLPVLLDKLCIDCCDLQAIINAKWFPIQFKDRNGDPVNIDCRDCRLDIYYIDSFGVGGPDLWTGIWQLYLLSQLQRISQRYLDGYYTWPQLVIIANDLAWFDLSGTTPKLRADFLEQFVALDMLRTEFGVCPFFKHDENEYSLTAILNGDDSSPRWSILLQHFVDGILACCEKGKAVADCQPPEFRKLLIEHIDIAAHLAGFREDGVDAQGWYHQFTNILRFAEQLSRLCDSPFSLGQLQFIITADEQICGDDPAPQQTKGEAKEFPFDLPDNEADFSLTVLRDKLLAIELDEKSVAAWTWTKIDAHLRADFGYSSTPTDDPLLELGTHFFPQLLERLGYTVSPTQKQFRVPLSGSPALMWNTGSVSPFRYDPTGSGALFATIPLSTTDVLTKLQEVRQLTNAEQEAVQKLIYAPAKLLAPFACLFQDYTKAQQVLIEAAGEEIRWQYFQRSFAWFYTACEVISKHLTEQVGANLNKADLDPQLTWKLLSRIYGDDNTATSSWEDDGGAAPTVKWSSVWQTSAFASLTRLAGLGLVGTYQDTETNSVLWRDVRGGLQGYSPIQNTTDSPVAGVISAIGFNPSTHPSVATIRNGFAFSSNSGELLGGAQGWKVHYRGLLYIEETGEYQFTAGAPTPIGEAPGFEQAKHSKWSLQLTRGSKIYKVLDNDWQHPDTPADCSVKLRLKRGMYEIDWYFEQPQVGFTHPENDCPQPTGWAVKWLRPGEELWEVIPRKQLYHDCPIGDLSTDITLPTEVLDYLSCQYHPSVRDQRRTSLRAYVAAMLFHGMGISAAPSADSGTSEVDYLLDHPDLFSGLSYYHDGSNWQPHLANLQLNLIPVRDNYCIIEADTDERQEPSLKRTQALFDWFEQLWEIRNLKQEAAQLGIQQVWHLWHECYEMHEEGASALHLQQFLGIEPAWHTAVTQFATAWEVKCPQLLNEEWTIRVFEAAKYIRKWQCALNGLDFANDSVQPSKWLSIGYDASGLEARQSLLGFVSNAFLKSAPNRANELAQINQRILHEEAQALLILLEGQEDKAPILSLLRPLVNNCEQKSRLDFAIYIVQHFLQQVRLGLSAKAGGGSRLVLTEKERLCWEKELMTFEQWQQCQLRHCYPENYAAAEIIHEDRRSPGFAFLQEQLNQQTHTLPVNGGSTTRIPARAQSLGHLLSLQERQPSSINTQVANWTSGATPPTSPSTYQVGKPNLPIRPKWRTLPHSSELDFWLQTAQQLGASYLRVAAAGAPPAAMTIGCNKADCCTDIEAINHSVCDYYLWLLPSRSFEAVRQQCEQWKKGYQLPELVYLPVDQKVYLMWAKVCGGRIEQLSWSSEGVMADSTSSLTLKGRFMDSLYFTVDGGTTALADTNIDGTVLYDAATILPGFRLDLATQSAVVLPQLGETLPDESLNWLFMYHDEGAPLLPKQPEGTAISFAGHLQEHCQFAAAKDWLDIAWNSTTSANSWYQYNASGEIIRVTDSTTMRKRLMLLQHLENLNSWIKHLHKMNTADAVQQARALADWAINLLGERPKTIQLSEVAEVNLGNFEPLHPGLNPQLLCWYDLLLDQKALLDNCLNAYRSNCYSLEKKGPKGGDGICSPLEACIPVSPYRFQALVNYTKEYLGDLMGIGNELLSAFEKGEQETLALIREGQGKQLADLNLHLKKNLFIEADWQVQSLEKTLEMTKCRLLHYQNLINVGLIAEEQDNLSLLDQSMVLQAASQALQISSQPPNYIPTSYVGVFPLLEIPGGKAISKWLEAASKVSSIAAGIQSTRAGKKATLASYARRLQDWQLQVKLLTIEVKKIEMDLWAATLRRDNAHHDMNNHQLQIEQAARNLEFMRSKFTGEELYNWQRRELAQLYHQMYECCLKLAHQAQIACNIEQGYTNDNWLSIPIWDNRHEGLLAGRRLMTAIRKMEQDFRNKNSRRYELSKSISLHRDFPRALLQLKYTGHTIVDVPEDIYAKDHPGHYCRLLRSVALTVPAVVGPYTNINSTLRLMGSRVRTEPYLLPDQGHCATNESDRYRMQENDSRFVIVSAGDQAMATSRGVSDSGNHQLDFRDERKLTFEQHGAAATFCLDMPIENNAFDMQTITDVIFELTYCAKEGGIPLEQAAREATKAYLPGNGERLLCLQDDRPDDWYEYQQDEQQRFALHLDRKTFPYIPGSHKLFVDRIELFIETAPCPPCDGFEVYFQEPKDSDCIDCDDTLVQCVKLPEMRGLFYGVLSHHFDIMDERVLAGHFKFPADQEVKRVYLLLSYGKENHICVNNDGSGCDCKKQII